MSSACEQPGMSSIEQAIEALTHLLARPVESLKLPLLQASGQLLAEDIHARQDVPLWDNSAMDGYALNCTDLPQEGGRLPLAGCQAAGDAISVLPPGHCMQIFTGAAVPTGANTVTPQENWAICILGLEFPRSDPGFEIRSNVASGWISLFFAASPESNIGWIL